MACSHESSSGVNVCSSGGEAPPEKCVLCSPGSLEGPLAMGAKGQEMLVGQEVEGSAASQRWEPGEDPQSAVCQRGQVNPLSFSLLSSPKIRHSILPNKVIGKNNDSICSHKCYFY